jgi:hypothetical protein
MSAEWEEEEEILLKEWGEKAMCFKWLHAQMHKKYRALNMRVTIPVIVLSTLTGTANFAQNRVPPNYRDYYPMIVGTLNLLAGVISTIAQYFKISEINEGHRVAALSWDKFARNIKVQLAKRRANREQAGVMMKYAKDEFDRLTEISPTISDRVIKKFSTNVKFMAKRHSSNAGGEGGEPNIICFSQPDICDNFVPIKIFDDVPGQQVELTTVSADGSHAVTENGDPAPR